MAYITGSAADMGQVRDAIVSACTADGWVWTNDVLSKDGVDIKIILSSGFLQVQGVGANTSIPLYIGPIYSTNANFPVLSWPVTYYLFVYAKEIYCIIKYGVGIFQWLAFGKSTVPGIQGHGGWFGASAAGKTLYGGTIYSGSGFNPGNSPSVVYFAPGLFFLTQGRNGSSSSYVHDGLSGWSATAIDGLATAPLVGLLPSEWTSESALIPIRSYAGRPENKISLVVELEHARHISIANLEPGQIITLGSDRWMCFPWYRKNTGPADKTTSGKLGWAIRYEGP